MKFWSLLGLIGLAVAAAACTPQDGERILLDAVVDEFVVDAHPQRIVFEKAVEGISQAWLDEESDADGVVVHTEFYSREGCALGGGAPMMSGATVRIAGHMEAGNFVSDTVWLLDISMDTGNCTNPPGE